MYLFTAISNFLTDLQCYIRIFIYKTGRKYHKIYLSNIRIGRQLFGYPSTRSQQYLTIKEWGGADSVVKELKK